MTTKLINTYRPFDRVSYRVNSSSIWNLRTGFSWLLVKASNTCHRINRAKLLTKMSAMVRLRDILRGWRPADSKIYSSSTHHFHKTENGTQLRLWTAWWSHIGGKLLGSIWWSRLMRTWSICDFKFFRVQEYSRQFLITFNYGYSNWQSLQRNPNQLGDILTRHSITKSIVVTSLMVGYYVREPS